MSRTTPTILCNLCMVEDLENGKVVLQYRSPEKTHWAGYAFPGGHIEEGESSVESGSQMREAAISSFATRQQNSPASSDRLKKEKFLGLRRTN